MLFTGVVSSGYGVASKNVRTGYYTNLGYKPFYGTLNLKTDTDITKFGDPVQEVRIGARLVKLWRCRINHEIDGHVLHTDSLKPKTIELLAPVKLRDHFKVEDGAKMDVDVVVKATRIDVLVPVLNRPLNAAPFMESLDASSRRDRVRVTVLADEDDTETIDAWAQVIGDGDQIVTSPIKPGTFARKVNLGYLNTEHQYMILCGDDLVFDADWAKHAIKAIRTGVPVIGTNDLGQDRKGQQSPHPLISREYVKKHGASWDGPGTVCHEGYWHNCVDREIALVARKRDMWSYDPKIILEHRHFWDGTVDKDETYELGTKHVNEDRKLLRSRIEDNWIGPNKPKVEGIVE